MTDLGQVLQAIAEALNLRQGECPERKSDYALAGPGK